MREGVPGYLMAANPDVLFHILPAHVPKRLAAREPSGQKLPDLDRMMLAGGACETAQLDQVTLIAALQSGVATDVRLNPQAASGAQVPNVDTTTGRKTKEPGPGRALARKRMLQLPRGIDPPTALWSKP